MLWEKKTSENKRGYLYVRETIYQRDKRTLKRKAPSKGDGTAYKQRGKYSKKKDIYCGKIIDTIPLVSPKTFKEYIIENKENDFLTYKTNITFDNLFNDFISYMLDIHDLNKEEFFNGKKIAYSIGSGYFSQETLKRVEEFSPKSSFIDHRELERFANKCFDAGIFDDEIVVLLYVKKIGSNSFETEELEENLREKTQSFKTLKGFIAKEHDKNNL